MNHDLKLDNESRKSEITEYNTTESNEHEDSAAKASEGKPSEHEATVILLRLVREPNESEVIEPSENELTEALTILKDIGLFNTSTNKPEKLHWLHTKLLHTYSNDEIQSSAIYGILERYPPGCMLADTLRENSYCCCH